MSLPEGMRPRDVVRESVLVVVRVVITGIAIVILLTPLPPELDGSALTTVSWLLIGALWLAVFIGVFVWQLRRVWRAKRPQARMVEAVIVIFVLFLAIFARLYSILSLNDPASFSQTLEYFDGFYFALVVLSTVGFGDITPVTTPARVLVMAQIASNLILLGFAVRIVSGAATKARNKREGEAAIND